MGLSIMFGLGRPLKKSKIESALCIHESWEIASEDEIDTRSLDTALFMTAKSQRRL